MEIIDNFAIADSNQLTFIDTNIDDYQSLIPEGHNTEIVLLDSSRDGIEQITEALATASSISAINIISHGNDGELQLGDSLLSHNSLQNYADKLQSWGHALTEDADILVFGCNLASTEVGKNFIQQLSDLTGADIAASDDFTGNAALNGDWDLEVATGVIETDPTWIADIAAKFDSVLVTYNGNEYQLTSGNVSWAQAQAEAESLGGNLVTISDAAEQAWLQDTFGGNERLWTGLSDRANEGEFTWVSGETAGYTNWAPNQPNNFGQGEDFTVLLASGQWNDVGGNANLRGIIEIGDDNPTEPEVFIYNGNEYQLTSANLPWTQAQAEAESLGGNLVSINDAAEQAWLQDTFGGNEQLWTGLSDRANEGEFTWISGQTFNYSNWALNEPNNFGQGEDFTVLISNGQWGDRAGNANLRGIIEIGDANPTESEVFNYNGREYQLTSTNLTWTQAQAEAESLGGNLVTINDAAEQAWVEDTFGGNQRLWIGLNDHTIEGEFVWPNDEATNFTNWANNQPNNFGLGEDFVALQKNGKWNDYAGGVKIRGVVEIGSNDPGNPGVIGLETNSYQVNESDSSVEVTVLRTQGSDGAITVDYQTFEASATENEDYIPVSGTLNFADGETSKSVTIPIIDDQQPEETENFSITIDNVTGGATLLAPRTALIDIIGTDGNPPGSGNGLRGEYFDDIDFTNTKVIRTDNTVDFNWGNGSPDPAIAPDTFSVRWTGEIEARFSEVYNFQTTTDDGIRLWINDQLVIDQFIDQPPTSHQGNIDLIAGQRYDIQLEYYENGGGAVAELAWSSASQPFEIVPESQLYSEDIPGPITLIQETVFSGLNQPTAIDWSPDGDLTFIAEKGGVIKVAEDGQISNFIDISAQVNGVRDRGLLDIAVHPDFFDGSPYVYALYTHDPAEVFDNSGLAGPDGIGNRAARLTRITADANTNFTTAVPGSEFVILGTNSTWENFNAFANSTNDFNEPPAGILADGSNLRDFLAADSESHTIGGVEFGPDGALYVSNGDGTSYNRVDPRTVRVQDIDNLSGKILRIDPITGDGLSDNPFYNGDAGANRSKVYQYGLRNPFRITVDPTDGKVYTGDVGWTQWEEINAAGPGANFGWPYYEGGSGTSLQTGGYRDLAEAQAFYNSGESAEPSILALNHGADGINAIVLGDIYRGNNFPEEYQGDLFFNDLGQGIVRNVSFDESGNVTSVDTFATGANVVVQIVEGPDGNLYYVDLDDGLVGLWKFA